MTLRLAGAVIANEWEFEGYAVSQNMPPLGELPLSRFCSFVRWYLTKDAEKQSEVTKFEMQLFRPPPNATVVAGPWSAEAETQAFGALKARLG